MPELRFLNALDYGIVILYMLMVAGVGAYMARYNKQTIDYFKGGGRIPWFLSALSLFVSGFSAFMFVGAAGFTYRNGGASLLLFTAAGWSYLLGYFIYGPLWRRSRIDTPMEFLTRRYSRSTTYFYTLLSVIPNILMLGISIYTLCIFVSTALGFSNVMFNLGFVTLSGFQLSMLVTGVVIVFYTVLGGLWAVIVTDSMQFIVLFLISLIALPAAYFFLGDGNLMVGIQRVITEAPEGYLGVVMEDQAPIFFLAYYVNLALGYNLNWHIAQRYYSVPDERGTKKMALVCAVFSFVAPLMWILPVLVARVSFPDLDAMWPELSAPSEAAFVTLALTVLPHGMLGIMVAAMFAATMSSADTTFNWLGAVLTKDVYVPVTEKLTGGVPTERRQLAVGKLTVMTLGIIAIGISLMMGRYGGAFDVYLKVNSLYAPAMYIPVLLGLVYTRTPWWTGIASAGVGFLAVIVTGLAANASVGLPYHTLDALFLDIRYTFLTIEMGRYELNTLVGVSAGVITFFLTAFVRHRPPEYATRLAAFERDLNTPAVEEGFKVDLRGLGAYRISGWFSIALGVILLMFSVPAIWEPGFALNLIAGALAIAVGWLIIAWTRRYQKRMEAVVEG